MTAGNSSVTKALMDKKIIEEIYNKIMNDPNFRLLEYLKYDTSLGRE